MIVCLCSLVYVHKWLVCVYAGVWGRACVSAYPLRFCVCLSVALYLRWYWWFCGRFWTNCASECMYALVCVLCFSFFFPFFCIGKKCSPWSVNASFTNLKQAEIVQPYQTSEMQCSAIPRKAPPLLPSSRRPFPPLPSLPPSTADPSLPPSPSIVPYSRRMAREVVRVNNGRVEALRWRKIGSLKS